MMRILDFDSLSPEEFLNRDSQAEEDVSAAVDEIIREVRRRGDEALIKSRGGTILPDDDPNSYQGNEKMFKDKNGQLRYEYMVGNESILTDLDKKAAEWSI